MARIDINGLGIAYEIIGSGDKPAIITLGGRFTKETPGVRDLAENRAKSGYKVVIWDRPNSGESDDCFEGESESILNADALAGLLRKLDMAPALVIGGSAGSPVPGLLPYDFLAIKAETLVFRSGISDPHHPRATTHEVHALIRNSTYVDPPWGDREWIDRMLSASEGLFKNGGRWRRRSSTGTTVEQKFRSS